MQKREIWKVILFGLITFSIYDIYWLIMTRREMVQKGETIPSVWLLFAPLLGLLSVVIFYLTLALGGRGTLESFDTVATILMFISVFSLFPVWIYWTYKYSKAVEHVTNGQTSFNTSFWLAMLLYIFGLNFLWPGLIQDGFNKVSDNGTPPNTPAPYQPPYQPLT